MILDVCCGSKMFWFQKKREDVVFMDIREEEYTICDKEVKVQPDIVGDFRACLLYTSRGNQVFIA